MEKWQNFRQMFLRKLDIQMEKDEVGPLVLHHTQILIQNGYKTKHRVTSIKLLEENI